MKTVIGEGDQGSESLKGKSWPSMPGARPDPGWRPPKASLGEDRKEKRVHSLPWPLLGKGDVSPGRGHRWSQRSWVLSALCLTGSPSDSAS